MNEIRILDKLTRRYVDVFYLVLLSIADKSILPEIYEIFGKDSMIKFLDIFSGTTIKVPSRHIIEKAIQQVDIYIQLTDKHTSQVAEHLAEQYGLEITGVWSTYQQMKNLCEKVLKIQVEPSTNGTESSVRVPQPLQGTNGKKPYSGIANGKNVAQEGS